MHDHMNVKISLLLSMLSTYFGMYLGYPQVCQYKNLSKEDTLSI